jgi:hypothetical protein
MKGITQATDSIRKHNTGLSHAGSIEAAVPIGAFAESHLAGLGLEYSWSNHRYGQNIVPQKMIGFSFHVGASYFLGKRETVAANEFRFGNYMYLHTLAGLIFNPGVNTNVSLLAGPGMGIYKNNGEIGLAVKLNGSYYLQNRLSIGPSLMYRGQSDAEDLWALMIRVCYSFR